MSHFILLLQAPVSSLAQETGGLLHWELVFACPSIQTVTSLFWFTLESSAPGDPCLFRVETLLLPVVSSLTLGRPGPAGRPSRVTSLQGLTKLLSPKLLKCVAKEKQKERKRKKRKTTPPFLPHNLGKDSVASESLACKDRASSPSGSFCT